MLQCSTSCNIEMSLGGQYERNEKDHKEAGSGCRS